MDKDGKKLVAEFVYRPCPNLNVFGFLSCRYAYAHDKNLKNIRKDFVC